MESNITPKAPPSGAADQSNPQSTKQVTVDVPEDRVAEFHAFFARFLAGPGGLRRRGRHGRHGHGHHHGHGHGHGHGRGCGRRERAEQPQPTAEPTPESTQL